MASSRDRDDEDEDERPRPKRRRDEDDDEDDDERPSKKGNRSRNRSDDDDDDKKPASKKLSILGLLAVIGGVLSLIVSFIPCLGMVSIGTGVVGLIMGGIALLIAGGSNHGKGLPIAGVIVNLLSIIVAILWIFVIAAATKSSYDDRIEREKEVENATAIPISAVQLSKEYDENFQKADVYYKGQVLEVYGKVMTISPESPGLTTLDLGVGTDLVECEFKSTKAMELSNVKKGQMIVVRGRCKGRDSFSKLVQLETCMLAKNPTHQSKPEPPPPPEPPPVVTDATKLLKDYWANVVKAEGLYKGQYLELKVEVERVSIEEGKLILIAHVGKEDEIGIIECEFPTSAKEALGKLNPKDKVTVRGTCKYTDGQVTLTGCVLVK